MEKDKDVWYFSALWFEALAPLDTCLLPCRLITHVFVLLCMSGLCCVLLAFVVR